MIPDSTQFKDYTFQNPWGIFLLSTTSLVVDIMKVDPVAFQKILKRHCLKDIEKSFQKVTPIGPEPHQFFSF